MSPVDVVGFPRTSKAAPNPDWGFSLVESMGNRFTGLLLIPTLAVGLVVGATVALVLARWLPPSRFEWPSAVGVLVAGLTFSALHFLLGRRPVGKPLRLTPGQLRFEGHELLNQGLSASPGWTLACAARRSGADRARAPGGAAPRAHSGNTGLAGRAVEPRGGRGHPST